MANNENDDRSQHENLMQAAKMIHDRMKEAGVHPEATVEQVAEALKNTVLPENGLVARGYTVKH